MERRSRFVYGPVGSEVTLDTTISVRPWLPMDRTVGGSRTAASGVPAAYIVRRDSLVTVTLRFWESEWLAILNWLQFGQSSAAFLWYPDVADAESVEVYLEQPLAGEEVTPTRDGEFPRVMELPVTLRGVGTAVPWTPYFRLA